MDSTSLKEVNALAECQWVSKRKAFSGRSMTHRGDNATRSSTGKVNVMVSSRDSLDQGGFMVLGIRLGMLQLGRNTGSGERFKILKKKKKSSPKTRLCAQRPSVHHSMTEWPLPLMLFYQHTNKDHSLAV